MTDIQQKLVFEHIEMLLSLIGGSYLFLGLLCLQACLIRHIQCMTQEANRKSFDNGCCDCTAKHEYHWERPAKISCARYIQPYLHKEYTNNGDASCSRFE